jgi:hypothetical protein
LPLAGPTDLHQSHLIYDHDALVVLSALFICVGHPTLRT